MAQDKPQIELNHTKPIRTEPNGMERNEMVRIQNLSEQKNKAQN